MGLPNDDMEVIPLSILDQQNPIHRDRVICCFILSAVVDEQRLKTALDTLIRHHWRKLGARVVKPDTRKQYDLEYHLPRVFADDYPLFAWTSEKRGGSLENVAPGLREPPGDGVSRLGSSLTLRNSLIPARWPKTRAEEEPDTPILHIHVVTFADSTSALSVNLPHSVADVLGLGNIMRAWFGLLDGKTPPPLVGHEEDVMPGQGGLSQYTREEVTRPCMEKVRPWGGFALKVAMDIPDFTRDLDEKDGIFFLPHELVRSLRERLRVEAEAQNKGDAALLSDNAVLSALFWKFHRIHRSSSRTISFSGAANLRGRIEALSGEKQFGFIHNGVIIAGARKKIEPSTPLSEMAVAVARGYRDALDPANVERLVAVKRECARVGQNPLVNELLDTSYFVANWCVAWKGLDWSSAVAGEKKKRPLEAVVIGFSGLDRPKRFDSYITSRTEKGYYVLYSGSISNVEAIEEYLAKDPELRHL